MDFIRFLQKDNTEPEQAILVKDKTEPTLFINRHGKPLTGGTLGERLKRLISQSENITLKEKNITLHSLRHSIATHLLANGDKVNGNTRVQGVADTFLEKDGTKTEQSYSTSSSGGLIVTKKHIP